MVVTPGTVVATGGDDESEIEGIVVVGGTVGATETGVKSGRGKTSKELIYANRILTGCWSSCGVSVTTPTTCRLHKEQQRTWCLGEVD